MQYNSSISQSFMVMSFVAAGLLLSVQLTVQTLAKKEVTKKEGTQVISLRPVSGNSVNQARGHSTVPPFNPQDDARLNHQQTEHTLAEHTLAEHTLAEHTLTEHTLTEHTLTEHTLTEHTEGDGERIPLTLANKPQAYSLPTPPYSTQIDPTQQDPTNQSITTDNSTDQTKIQQERTTALVVDLSDRQLIFHQQGEEAKTYPIAVGKTGWETPLGEFTVTDKDPSPLWQHPLTEELVPAGPDSPLGSRWIGFWSDGIHQIGFHGTNQAQSIGQAISHGCIRLHDGDIQELYAQVALGTPVIVQP